VTLTHDRRTLRRGHRGAPPGGPLPLVEIVATGHGCTWSGSRRIATAELTLTLPTSPSAVLLPLSRGPGRD
jgi:hypothetical protein